MRGEENTEGKTLPNQELNQTKGFLLTLQVLLLIVLQQAGSAIEATSVHATSAIEALALALQAHIARSEGMAAEAKGGLQAHGVDIVVGVHALLHHEQLSRQSHLKQRRGGKCERRGEVWDAVLTKDSNNKRAINPFQELPHGSNHRTACTHLLEAGLVVHEGSIQAHQTLHAAAHKRRRAAVWCHQTMS